MEWKEGENKLKIKDSELKLKLSLCNVSSGPLAKDLRDHTGRGFEPIANKPAYDALKYFHTRSWREWRIIRFNDKVR